MKKHLQCYTPAALLETKKQGILKVINRTGIIQLDFDYTDIYMYDVEELKRAVFSLLFIGFCGLSCSGEGFYALALIAEPERLADYAEHCFDILLKYGIKADQSKGKKVENLRYVSYDSNMLIRENPKPLYVKHFKQKKIVTNSTSNTNQKLTAEELANERLIKGIKMLREVMEGSRWETVQKVAYTIGGLGNTGFFSTIEEAINSNSAFAGQESKYLKCAEVCFEKGFDNPYNDFK
ncbi:MAG: BT4734/BF3469 family protein [Chitinophagaceae bacterium]